MALVLENLDEEVAPEELAEMGSFNHGYLQLKIGSCFLRLPDFIPSSEFTLDISAISDTSELELIDTPDSFKPDIAVYNEWSLDFQNDVIKGDKMPVLAIEILSPMQGTQRLIDKFKIYFALGVQSCWLVYPHAEAIAVYQSPNDFEVFAKGDVIDDIVNVRLPLSEIFS